MNNLILLPITLYCFIRDIIIGVDKVICAIGAGAICMVRITLQVGAYVLDGLGSIINKLWVVEFTLLALLFYILNKYMPILLG